MLPQGDFFNEVVIVLKSLKVPFLRLEVLHFRQTHRHDRRMLPSNYSYTSAAKNLLKNTEATSLSVQITPTLALNPQQF